MVSAAERSESIEQEEELRVWEHYCVNQNGWVSVDKGYACSFCGKGESRPAKTWPHFCKKIDHLVYLTYGTSCTECGAERARK